MSSIDNRIVNMQFNNKGFESGVAITLNSLKKLNESLKMKDASKGLTDVSNSLGKVNSSGMSGLSRGIETVTSRFSTLGVIATTALMNITNKAVNAGTALAKSLTVEPVMDGFREYELKMDSIQTILTNTAHAGTTLEDVTAVLGKLNEYADLTIYNFADMTDNISKFTAAGVDLDTSVDSIKGLANLAAASGVNATKASGAMYQLSQALAAGKVSLMDWMSIEKAGMGGKLFQDALIRTSENLGTGADAMIKKYGTFRESLTKGQWLTTEVLTETLKQISGAYTEADLIAQGYTKNQAKEIMTLAQNATKAATEVKTVSQLFGTMKESVGSGWAQSWEYIIGNKDQATKTLTSVKEAFDAMIKPSTDARNAMLKFWNETGGRDQVITGLSNVFGSLGKILGSVKDAFSEVFPPITGWNLVQLSNKFRDFTEKIKISDETAKKIKDTFQGVFSVFGIVGDAFKSVISVFSSGVGILGKVGNTALTVTSSIGKFFTNIYESLHASRIFENAANTVKAGLNSIQRFFSSCGETIGIFIGQLSKLDFSPILDMLAEIGTGLGKGLADVFEGLGKSIGNLDFNKLIVALTALAGKDIFKTIKDSILGFKGSLESFGKIGEGVTSVLGSVKNALEAYQTDLNSGTLIKIASAIGVLAASLLVLASIKPAQMENALVAMTTMLIELVAALAVLFKVIGGAGFLQLSGLSATLLGIASAMLILSAAIAVLSGLSWDGIAKGLVGVGGAMLVLVGAMKLLKPLESSMSHTAAGMIAVAAALVIMAQAIKMLGQLELGDLLEGLLGVGVALLELALFTKYAKMDVMGVKSSTGILLLAAALLVLQQAVKMFGAMDIGSLITGLGSVGMLLAEIAVFSTAMQGTQGLLSTSAAMVVMAAAINIMVPAVKGLGSLSWEAIAKGLLSMAGALSVLGVASAVISGADLAATGAGVAVMSAALLVLSAAMHSLGGLSWDQLAISLIALSVALIAFSSGMKAMVDGLPGAAAMLVMAAAFAVLTPQLIALGNMSLEQIGYSLIALAGAFIVIGAAGAILTPIAPGLALVAAAIALLGVACVAAGAGVALFATGMATLAAVGAAGGFAIAEVLRQLINLLPQFASALGKSMVEFAKTIGEGMPTLAKAMGQCMIGILEAVSDAIPKIIEVGLELLTALCDVLLEGMPRLIDVAVQMVVALVEGLASNVGILVDAAVNLVVNFLNALAGKVGEIIQAGIDLAVALINGLADGIRDNTTKVQDAITNLCKAFIDSFKQMLGISGPSTVFNDLGLKTILGLANGIASKVPEVLSKIKEMGTNMISNIKSRVGEFLSSGASLISNLASGVSSKVSSVVTTIRSMISSGVEAVTSAVSRFLSAGKSIISNLANGVKSGASAVSSGIKSAISAAKSAASGMVSQFSSIGKSIISGLASGIRSMAESVASAARNVVSKAISAAKSVLQINSPSKVFMAMGNSIDEGLVKGIEDDAHTVDEPARNLARRAIKSVSRTISAISNTLDSEINPDLTITPVMDLTNVNNGVKTIRDMIAENDQFSINANTTGAMSSSMGTIQNGSESERIVAALKELKASMNGNNTTYQINGITYDDGSNVTDAVATLVRAARIERRI